MVDGEWKMQDTGNERMFVMMKRITVIMFIVFSCVVSAKAEDASLVTRFCYDVQDDYMNFYSWGNLGMLGGGFVVGGIIANSSIDGDINEWYTNDVKSADTDDISEVVKEFGNGLITLPLFIGAGALSAFSEDSAVCEVVGEWGQKSLRAVLVGAPPMLALSIVTGGSRPSDEEGDSKWQPFKDGNGVSGHSFMGAVPFITAAKMADDPGLKVLFYAGSALCGISRINDGDHYFSQSLLGWWIAYLSASSVDKTRNGGRIAGMTPIIMNDCTGVGYMMEF